MKVSAIETEKVSGKLRGFGSLVQALYVARKAACYLYLMESSSRNVTWGVVGNTNPPRGLGASPVTFILITS